MSTAPPTIAELTGNESEFSHEELYKAAKDSANEFFIALREHVAELEETMNYETKSQTPAEFILTLRQKVAGYEKQNFGVLKIRSKVNKILENLDHVVSFGQHVRTLDDAETIAFCLRYHVFIKRDDFWILANRLFASYGYAAKKIEPWIPALREYDQYRHQFFDDITYEKLTEVISRDFYRSVDVYLKYNDDNSDRYSPFCERYRSAELTQKAILPARSNDNKAGLMFGTWTAAPQQYFADTLRLAKMLESKRVPYYAVRYAMRSAVFAVSKQANYTAELKAADLDIIRCYLRYDLVCPEQIDEFIGLLPATERAVWSLVI